jgi:hypothetical protein
MSAWTGTRVPAKTGAPPKISGDDVTADLGMGVTLLQFTRGPWRFADYTEGAAATSGTGTGRPMPLRPQLLYARLSAI